MGGIAAYCPGGVPNCYASTHGGSCASNLIYEVSIDPATGTAVTGLTLPAEG